MGVCVCLFDSAVTLEPFEISSCNFYWSTIWSSSDEFENGDVRAVIQCL